jgi:hypothetical protein
LLLLIRGNIKKTDSYDPSFSMHGLKTAAADPTETGESRKAQIPKMCKSQKRKRGRFCAKLIMLIPAELHNWLPFIELRTNV